MFRGILPKEFNFYEYFEKHIALTIEAAKEFKKMAAGETTPELANTNISKLETDADNITHLCTEQLHKTFITPMERTDIHNLIKRLDDIMDFIDGAISRIVLYEIKIIRDETLQLADIILKSATEIEAALKGLRNMKHTDDIQVHCKALHELENDGDNILRSAVLRLFKENEAIPLIMWKEILERLEKAIDRCEAVANIIEGVVIASA